MPQRTVLALLFTAAAALWGLCLSGPGLGTAHAQASDYPRRQPVKVVIPFPAGGPTDGMARIVSDRLGQVLGQSVIVENRGGGAGGSVGAKAVASADPDGYTVMLTPGGSLTSGPAVHRNIGYDPVKVFAPVCQLIEAADVIEVHPSLPVTTLTELISYAKANPGKISWGSQGFGVAPHLLLELFNLEAGVSIAHVPYRGTAPMLTAIVAGEVQVVIDPLTTSLPHLQAGAVRPIAIAGPARTPQLPNVPTTGEQGFPDIDSPFWLGVVVPAGTTPGIIARLNAAFRDSLAAPEVRSRIAALGADIKIGTPEEFGAMLANERALWLRVAKEAHISVE
jgi:tripartite-type tricarboxylate transporter receptor subunit TctC